MQPGRYCLPHSLDPELTARVKQVAAVEYGHRADVLRPDLVRPQHELILGGQPVNGHESHLQTERHGQAGPRQGLLDTPPMGRSPLALAPPIRTA